MFKDIINSIKYTATTEIHKALRRTLKEDFEVVEHKADMSLISLQSQIEALRGDVNKEIIQLGDRIEILEGQKHDDNDARIDELRADLDHLANGFGQTIDQIVKCRA